MSRGRQYSVFFFFIILLVLLFSRLFYLQVLNYERFSLIASGQHNKVLKIEPRRGTIYDRYMEPLAINLDVPSVYCDPRSIRDKEHTADMLAGILGIDRDGLLEKLNRDKAFVWVKRKIDTDTAEKIKEAALEGVFFMTESRRNYPSDNLAAHVIGFVGVDNDGLEGIETVYDGKLKGKFGWRHLVRDAKRRTVLYNDKDSIPAQNGYNIVLTIDGVIQCIVEEEIREMVKRHNAASASIIVMDPGTGEVLAMANYPDYDLNSFSEAPREVMKNTSISNVYEPGSVFKIVTACAALNERAVELEDMFDCENGEYNVGGRILHDFHRYGNLSFADIIAKSSNIGVVKVAQMLGGEKLFAYMQMFGFGDKTGIDLPGEVSGITRPPTEWSRSDISTIPIGQGVAVTPLQMICAVNVIANGGYLMKPYVVDRITTWEGETCKEFRPGLKRRVLNRETSERMKEAMACVVTDGTGKRAESKLYEVCGKTGTAQMVKPGGGYYDDKYYATFIGFAPRERPVISVIVTAKDPHPVHFGGSVAGPVFKKITERALQYLESNREKAERAETFYE